MQIEKLSDNIFGAPLTVKKSHYNIFKIVNCENKTCFLTQNRLIAQVVAGLLSHAKVTIVEKSPFLYPGPFDKNEGLHYLDPYKNQKLLEIHQQTIRISL